MHEDLLMRAGLSEREAKVYMTLMREGEMTAGKISKKTGIIRTNAYDVLNGLVQKGFVAYIIRNGNKYFRAAEAEKVVDFVSSQRRDLEEVEKKIKGILGSLKPPKTETRLPIIEIYEGKEGMKTILSMSILESVRVKKEILGISVQQQKCRQLAGPYHKRWYNDREKYKIRSRYIMSSEEKIIPVKYTQFRIMPKEAKNPDEIFIFGDTTAQFFFIGSSFLSIIVKSPEITQRYRDYFEFLWKVSKEVR